MFFVIFVARTFVIVVAEDLTRPSRRPRTTLLPSAAVMCGWRAVGVAGAACVAGVVPLAALLEFLAPGLSCAIRDPALPIGGHEVDARKIS